MVDLVHEHEHRVFWQVFQGKFTLGDKTGIRHAQHGVSITGDDTAAGQEVLQVLSQFLICRQFPIEMGLYIQELEVDFFWLIWLGLAPRSFTSLDYVPLLPWFGVVLMGMAGGALLYKDLGRRFPLPDISAWPPVRGLIFLGRNSLAVYILHQPLLLGLIYLAEGPSLFSFAWK